MEVDYIEHYGSDLAVVNAARVSLDKESMWETEWRDEIDVDSRTIYQIPINVLADKDKKLIHYLAKHKHTSCFEHMGATLRLKVPIFIARQIQRHRTFSYNEVSRRYVDTPPEFFWPDKWRGRAANVKQGSSDKEVESFLMYDPVESWTTETGAAYAAFLDSIEKYYQSMLDGGVAPELARMILPQSMYTSFYMTGNLRAWSHFLHLRLDAHAQKEVQDVAKMVADILTPLFPVSMEALLDNAE